MEPVGVCSKKDESFLDRMQIASKKQPDIIRDSLSFKSQILLLLILKIPRIQWVYTGKMP